jgi:urease accessory protein
VIVLGVLAAFALRAPVWLGAVMAAGFGLFHGHAHGTEAMAASGLEYLAGFAIATALLHGAGVAMGAASSRFGVSALFSRALAAAAAIGGMALALS